MWLTLTGRLFSSISYLVLCAFLHRDHLRKTELQRKKELNVRRRLCSWWGLNKTYFLVTFASDLPFLVLASSTWAWSSQRLAVLSPSASLGLLAPCPLPLGWPRCLEQGGGGAKAEPGSAPELSQVPCGSELCTMFVTGVRRLGLVCGSVCTARVAAVGMGRRRR